MANSKMYALILDVPSIQKFVFGSNKMRINLGASYLIKDLYRKICLSYPGLDPEHPETWYQPNNSVLPAIAYKGGGNMVVFFNDHSSRKEFVLNASRYIIENYPGLKMVIGIYNDFDLGDEKKDGENPTKGFKNSMNKLHGDLHEKKNALHIQTHIPIQSLGTMCEYNLQAASRLKVLGDDGLKWLSKLAATQWNKEKDLREQDLEDYDFLKKNYDKSNKSGYRFTNELEHLGQKEENSKIAIVHIDGNAIGEEFAKCNTLKEYQHLSQQVEKKYCEAFNECVDHFIAKYMPVIEEGDLFKIGTCKPSKDEDPSTGDRYYLPFRPLVFSGDDLTFVAEGRIGIFLAEQFLQVLSEKTIEKLNGKKLDLYACAGVAIVKTHFPFYQAYALCEELCSMAKSVSRSEGNSGSYINFAVVHGAGNMDDAEAYLDSIFKINDVNVKEAAYKIVPIDESDPSKVPSSPVSLKSVLNHTKINLSRYSSTKRHEIRELIGASEEEINLFNEQLKLHKYPTLKNINNMHAYYEQLELMDFYLPFALQNEPKK